MSESGSVSDALCDCTDACGVEGDDKKGSLCPDSSTRKSAPPSYLTRRPLALCGANVGSVFFVFVCGRARLSGWNVPYGRHESVQRGQVPTLPCGSVVKREGMQLQPYVPASIEHSSDPPAAHMSHPLLFVRTRLTL